jgi:HAMP domain-containing protein
LTLRTRTLLMVMTLLVIAVVASAAVLTWSARQALLAEAESEGVLLARLLALSAQFANEVTTEVETAIGEQMIVEGTIAAHMVALAEAAGFRPDRINAHLRAIARDTVLNEFWITDEKGHAYLHNVADVDFTFSPDPARQPQAHMFWPLLTGEQRTVVQAARKREIDAEIFKYAGVGGVDKRRIVQVGYRFTFLEQLAKRVGLPRLVDELVAGKTVIAIRVVDPKIVTLAYSAVPGQYSPPEFGESDKATLQEVIAERRPHTYLDGMVLTIMAPILRRDGSVLGATVVHLPTDRIYDVIRQKLWLAGMVAVGVLSSGLLASIVLSRRVTGPVSRLAEAAAAVESHTFEPATLAAVTHRRDELGNLARVFGRMAEEVYAREERLRRELQQLRIEIDEVRKDHQVAEITETEYFQKLRSRAQTLRARLGTT